MKRSNIWTGGLYGLLSSIVLMALSYLGYLIAGLPFLPFDLFDWLTRSLPRAWLEAGVRGMLSALAALGVGQLDAVAKLVEQILALGIPLLVGCVFGLVLGGAGLQRRGWLVRAGLLGGLLLWSGMLLVETALPHVPGSPAGFAWLLALLLAWGGALALLIRQSIPAPGATQPAAGKASRRSFLILAGSSLAGLAVLILGLRRGGLSQAALTTTSPGEANPGGTSGPAASPSQAVLDRRIPPAPGTRSEVTPIASFYRVDINPSPPRIDGAAWRLAVTGLVDHPREFSLDELRAFPAVTQAATLACISNPVGGKLISTAYWSGVRFKDLLALVGLQPGATELNVMAADGYYEPLSLAEAMDERTLLVYAMNGQPLLPEHGFPLRSFIPGHYGLKQPKWITALAATNKHGLGFWLETSPPKTASAIDAGQVERSQLTPDGLLPLGGIAWAADRGIRKVELQIDDGEWMEAQLRSPALSPLTWVQWRYDWKAAPGSHLVKVRATDGAGALQEDDASNTTGHGSTGLHTVNIHL
jgi:DMSO/TMAO reductase YedYZ molybdopterin-dependent catalytic subunit